MVTISHEWTWGRDEARGLRSITDMETAVMGGRTFLYTIDASDGTITSFDVTGGRKAETVNRRTVDDEPASSAQTLAIVENAGQCVLLTGGPTTGEVRAFDMNESAGSVAGETAAFPLGGDPGSVSDFAVYDRGGVEYVAAAGVEGELIGLSPAGSGISPNSVVSGGDTYLDAISAVEFVRGPFGHYIFAASGTQDAITVARASGGGKLTSYETLDAQDGLWVSAISDLATVDTLGLDYLLVADRGTGSVTSVFVSEEGTLEVRDAIHDDLGTRYAEVSVIEAFSVVHRDFAAVAGSDGGFTILEVLNDGTLREAATFVDDGLASLSSVSAIEVVVEDTQASLFVSSTGDGGFSQFSIDFGNMGPHRVGLGPDEKTGGTNKDDLITGSDLDDSLYGNSGDDVIWDGAGEDYISGAAGADIFMMAYDGEDDLIVRFEPGLDKIDLSDWPLLYDVSRLDIVPYDAGVRVHYFDEMIRITSLDRTPITTLGADDFIFA